MVRNIAVVRAWVRYLGHMQIVTGWRPFKLGCPQVECYPDQVVPQRMACRCCRQAHSRSRAVQSGTHPPAMSRPAHREGAAEEDALGQPQHTNQRRALPSTPQKRAPILSLSGPCFMHRGSLLGTASHCLLQGARTRCCW